MRPLLAVRRLVLLSGVTFGLVFVASYVRSTGRPRARHITFVEAGAAMPRASATRFRAFYDDTYAQVRVQATHVESSLAVVNTDHDVRAQTVVVDSTMRLEQLHSKPWKTLLVREEGFFDVGGGISLTQKQGDLVVTNRSNQDLLGAVARGADGRVYFCERIASGEQLALSETHSIHVVGAPPRAVYFPLLLHNFDWRMDDVSPGLSTAWQAIEALRAGEVDWWPPDVPVLIAQLATGEGRALDSGYQIESEYVLIRVLGYGGSS